MNKFTATAPNGAVLVRNTQNHIYNYAVLVMYTKEHRAKLLESSLYGNHRILDEIRVEGNEKYIARIHKEIAKANKELANVADVWVAAAWRRDHKSAVYEANSISDAIIKGWSKAASVLVVETTHVVK
jgi:hypothetical protein